MDVRRIDTVAVSELNGNLMTNWFLIQLESDMFICLSVIDWFGCVVHWLMWHVHQLLQMGAWLQLPLMLNSIWR